MENGVIGNDEEILLISPPFSRIDETYMEKVIQLIARVPSYLLKNKF